MGDPILELIDENMRCLTPKSACTRQGDVITEPDSEWVAQAIEAFPQNHEAPLIMDPRSQQIFEGGQGGNAFTGLVEVAKKTIYLFPLAANPSYSNTEYPNHQVQLPGDAGAGGATCAPLDLADGPVHQQLAQILGKGAKGPYIGFTVTKRDDGSGRVSSVTSGTQNIEVFKSKFASENWTRLIVMSVVVSLTERAGPIEE